ncbi:AAA family ATPase [Brenneria goodwinii]|uniref:KAP family P-loop NTPase fold protein n=1 Tax=Brenneria goodwinii TaxID=1109412 RepID=UPI000BAFCAF5|nr:P-loop NTPase fold protein [Brenneria goodwinii]ATA22842.1 AAA family ATPase [Brenneria goodwinii]
MGKYHNDKPITGGADDPDLLNRLDFSNKLAEILLLKLDDSCLTVSLEGEWGYGKTSIINLVKGALQENDTLPIIVEYNPWLAGNPESLIQDFLLQLSSQLHVRDSSAEALTASKELITYSGLFSVAKLIPGAEPWASVIEKALSTLSITEKNISKLKELDLIGRKKKVIDALKKIKTPIIVIIDDIDRLTPSETFQILRLIKAVADFDGTSFLLAFDSNYLTSVLSRNDIVNSYEYINKIIQLRVPLPLISEHGMSELATDEFEKLGGEELTNKFDGDQDRFSWIYSRYFKKIIKSPRDLKRLFNHLRFVLDQVGGQVCFSDLFALSLIATRANPVYEHIKKCPEAYIGRNILGYDILMDKSHEVIEKLSKERDGYLEHFIDNERKLIKNLLHEIFPLIVADGYSYPFETSNADAAGRVSAQQRLHIALHYSTPIGYVTDLEVNDFISGSIDRKEFLNQVLSNNAEERFFEMLTNYADKCADNSFDVLVSIYDIFINSQKLKSSFMCNYGILKQDIHRNIYWITSEIISKNNSKYELIKKLIERKESAPFSADILINARKYLEERNIQEQWLDDTQFIEIENIFQDIAFNILSNENSFDDYFISHMFYELKRTNKEKTKILISNLLDGENGIVKVADLIKYLGRDSTNGPYIQVSEDSFDSIMDLKKIRALAKEINMGDLPMSTQAAIKSILYGGKYYLRDGVAGEEY